MKNMRSLLLAAFVVLGTVGCGDSATLVAPAAPSFNEGGHTVGSGSKDPTTTQPTTQTPPTTTTEARSDSTARDGGHTVGSGS